MRLIRNGLLYTRESERPFQGDVLLRYGKIVQIGQSIPTTEDMAVLDAQGMRVFPGFIDAHSHIGIAEEKTSGQGDESNEGTNPITPCMRAIDAVNPMDSAFNNAIAAGVTGVLVGPGSANPIGGQFAFLKTDGRRVDDMIVLAPAAIKIAFGENPMTNYGSNGNIPSTRMGIASLIREQLFKAQRYLRDKQEAELDEELRHLATKTCIISTPYDAYKTLRLVFHSVPLGRVCRRDELVSFHLDDLVDDVREVVLKHRFRSYPILDEDEKVVGVLSRYHLLRPRRKRVVLVDHNEAAQSVPGLEEAEILEIIDHHRLADIQTTNPIYFRNEPVGSTNTIIAGMFQEHGLMPSQTMAGLMAAAIVSDTVMFKSPTCTDRDRRMAERMARIANVSLDELGKLLFSSSSGGNRSVHDLLFTDFKEFHIAGHSFGVSQITCVDSASMLDRKQEFLDAMGETMRQRDYSMMLLMLTDVLLEGTQLLYIGDDDTITQAFAQEAKDNTVFLPRVMSRKKQVIPMLTALWG